MFCERSEQTTFNEIKDVAKLLKKHDHYLICPHINPDPDSLGSAVALYLGLKSLGKDVKIFLPEETPPYMDYLLQHADVQLEQPLDMNMKMIFVDLSTPKQLHPKVKLVYPWLVLDHHLGPMSFTKYAYVDPQSPATADIVYQLLEKLRCPIDKTMATCLYSALIFDTRNLTSPNTTSETIIQAAKLVEAGAEPDYVNRMLNQQKPLNLIKLIGEVFSELSYTLDDSLVWAVISQDLLNKYNIDETECDYIITDLLTIATAEVILFFKECKNGQVKVSWRSKCDVNVNEIARQFGGGGHRYASAARLNLPLKQSVRQVVSATKHMMREVLVEAA